MNKIAYILFFFPVCFCMGQQIDIGGGYDFKIDTIRNTLTVWTNIDSPLKERIKTIASKEQTKKLLENSAPAGSYLPPAYDWETIVQIKNKFPDYKEEDPDQDSYYIIYNADSITRDTLYHYCIRTEYRLSGDTFLLQKREIKNRGPLPNLSYGYNHFPGLLSSAESFDLSDKTSAAEFVTRFGEPVLDSLQDADTVLVMEKNIDGVPGKELIVYSEKSSDNMLFPSQKNYRVWFFKTRPEHIVRISEISFGDCQVDEFSLVHFSGYDHYFLFVNGLDGCTHFRATLCASLIRLIPLDAVNHDKIAQLISY